MLALIDASLQGQKVRSGLSSVTLEKVPLAITIHWLFGDLNGAAWSTSAVSSSPLGCIQL